MSLRLLCELLLVSRLRLGAARVRERGEVLHLARLVKGAEHG